MNYLICSPDPITNSESPDLENCDGYDITLLFTALCWSGSGEQDTILSSTNKIKLIRIFMNIQDSWF